MPKVQIYIDEQLAAKLYEIEASAKVGNTSGLIRWLIRRGLDSEAGTNQLLRKIAELERRQKDLEARLGKMRERQYFTARECRRVGLLVEELLRGLYAARGSTNEANDVCEKAYQIASKWAEDPRRFGEVAEPSEAEESTPTAKDPRDVF